MHIYTSYHTTLKHTSYHKQFARLMQPQSQTIKRTQDCAIITLLHGVHIYLQIFQTKKHNLYFIQEAFFVYPNYNIVSKERYIFLNI